MRQPTLAFPLRIWYNLPMNEENNSRPQEFLKAQAHYKDLYQKLAQDLPWLADLLVTIWRSSARTVSNAAESILRKTGLDLCDANGKTTHSFEKYEILTRKDGTEALLMPYAAQTILLTAPLMDRLTDDTLKHLREASDEIDASWQKFFAAIVGRFPELSDACAQAEASRIELHNYVADLYLGERPPEFNDDWFRPFTALSSALPDMGAKMTAKDKEAGI